MAASKYDQGDRAYLKDPISRIGTVEDGAMQATEAGDHERALFLRMQALALAKLIHEDPSVQDRDMILMKAHMKLADTYMEMGLGEQAYYHGQKAMDRLDPKKPGEGGNTDFTVTTLTAVARSMIKQGDNKSWNYLSRAILINHDLHSPDDITNYPIHEAFGDMHMGHGDAKAMLEVEELKGGHHKKSGSHGDGEDTKDMDYEKAFDEYGKAWELIAGKEKRKMLRMLAPKDARMASIYSKMAKIRGIQGNDEESIQLYEKSLACHEKADKPNVAAIAKTEYELGVIYHKHKKYSDSLNVLDKAVKKCEGKQELGNQPLLLLVKKQQAITLYDGNQVEAAKEKFDELMSLQRMEYGGSSVIVAETLKYLGDVHVALEKRPIAQKYYNRALRILRRRLGCKDETVKQLEHYVRQLNFFM
ncbi:unnamed protein product [Sphagnum troendelagicum]